VAYTLKITVYGESGEKVRDIINTSTLDIAKDFEVDVPTFNPDDGGKVTIKVSGNFYEWDGKNNQGTKVGNGVYYIKVETTDIYGFTHMVVKDVTVLANNSKLQMRIFNSAGEIVKTLPVTVTAPYGTTEIKVIPESPKPFVPGDDPYAEIIYNGETIKWDGTNNFGRIVDSGAYVLQIVNIDENGYRVIAQANITVLHDGYQVISDIKIVPNPMDMKKTSVVSFKYTVTAGTKVTVRLYNINGEIVKTLSDPTGTGEIKWDISAERTPYATGLYVCVIEAQATNGITKREIDKFFLKR